jgi:hypothetical protein
MSALTIALTSACADIGVSIQWMAVIVLAATILLFWAPVMRGVFDVGFVGGALRGERKRHQGL